MRLCGFCGWFSKCPQWGSALTPPYLQLWDQVCRLLDQGTKRRLQVHQVSLRLLEYMASYHFQGSYSSEIRVSMLIWQCNLETIPSESELCKYHSQGSCFINLHDLHHTRSTLSSGDLLPVIDLGDQEWVEPVRIREGDPHLVSKVCRESMVLPSTLNKWQVKSDIHSCTSGVPKLSTFELLDLYQLCKGENYSRCSF